MKKGVELTLNTMIIAALVLLVLIILGFFLIKGSGAFITGNSCESNNGKCVSGTCEEGYFKSFAFTCKDNQICCTPLSSKK